MADFGQTTANDLDSRSQSLGSTLRIISQEHLQELGKEAEYLALWLDCDRGWAEPDVGRGFCHLRVKVVPFTVRGWCFPK